MRQQDQVAEIHKLLSHLETRTTAMADSVYRNPVSDYICHEQAALERETFFRRGPIAIGLRRLHDPRLYRRADTAG